MIRLWFCNFCNFFLIIASSNWYKNIILVKQILRFCAQGAFVSQNSYEFDEIVIQISSHSVFDLTRDEKHIKQRTYLVI